MSTATRSRKPKVLPNGRLPPGVPPFPIHRFTVDEYHRMIETGMISENDRVELIHGWIVPKMTLNPPHAYAVTALMEQLLALGAPAVVRIQQPITTTDSEPEPDVVFATGTRAAYKKRHPYPADVILLVEVADSSLNEDQTTKLELYAGAKVGVYWIVNLVNRRVEVYTQPKGGKNPTYKTRTDCGPNDAVPVVIADKQIGTIAVKELLP